MTRIGKIALIGLITAFVWSCSDNSTTEPQNNPRTYDMGFSFYPTVFQSAQPSQYVSNFLTRSDMMTIHWDGNVPWPLLAQCPDLNNCELGDDSLLIAMHTNLQQTVDGLKVQATGFRERGGRSVYLALSPLNIDRDGIVRSYAGLSAPPPGTTFADPAVSEAFGRFVSYMVGEFKPDYCSHVIELNMYAINKPDDFTNLVALAEDVYMTVKTEFPLMPLAPTIQWEFFKVGWDTPARRRMLENLANDWADFADYYPVSTYPNIQLGQSSVDSTWYRFDQYGLRGIHQSSLMISECGIQPLMQQDMLRTLSQLLEENNGEALVYFFLEDMDHLDFPPSFENVGLYHDKQSPTLTPHPGLATWDSLFAGPSLR